VNGWETEQARNRACRALAFFAVGKLEKQPFGSFLKSDAVAFCFPFDSVDLFVSRATQIKGDCLLLPWLGFPP
jgi:hypothetical protein